MSKLFEQIGILKSEDNDRFRWGPAIAAMLLILLFVAANIYVLVSSMLY